jgi:hypothetical protein
MILFSVAANALKDVEAKDGCFLASRRHSLRITAESALSAGSRHLMPRNMHIPAPVGSASILTALRSRKRLNSPLSANTRRHSGSVMPLRFEVGLSVRITPGATVFKTEKTL